MSRQGKFENLKGDSSEIIVEEALKFMKKQAKADKPFFCVIWYGTPHSPWMALEKDLKEKILKRLGRLVFLVLQVESSVLCSR